MSINSRNRWHCVVCASTHMRVWMHGWSGVSVCIHPPLIHIHTHSYTRTRTYHIPRIDCHNKDKVSRCVYGMDVDGGERVYERICVYVYMCMYMCMYVYALTHSLSPSHTRTRTYHIPHIDCHNKDKVSRCMYGMNVNRGVRMCVWKKWFLCECAMVWCDSSMRRKIVMWCAVCSVVFGVSVVVSYIILCRSVVEYDRSDEYVCVYVYLCVCVYTL